MPELDYIARCANCGGISFWLSSTLPPREIAKEVASVIRGGRSIERMSTEDTRKADWCFGQECRRPAAKQLDLALAAPSSPGGPRDG